MIGVTRSALRPLGALAAAADEIAKSNLECAIPESRRTDEVGRLAGAFRAMRDALKKQHLERRWAAQALEHQLKYKQLVIDSVEELVFVLTKSLSITRINPAVTRLAGHDEDAVIRTPLTRLLSLVREPAEAGGQARDDAAVIGEVLKAGRSLSGAPARLKTADGRVIGVRLNLVPLLDQNRVVGAVATLRADEADLPRDGRV